MSMKFRSEMEQNISKQMVYKAMILDEITEKMSVER